MEKLLERNEVKQKDKWDLESVYKNIDDLKKDLPDKVAKELFLFLKEYEKDV